MKILVVRSGQLPLHLAEEGPTGVDPNARFYLYSSLTSLPTGVFHTYVEVLTATLKAFGRPSDKIIVKARNAVHAQSILQAYSSQGVRSVGPETETERPCLVGLAEE